MNRKRLLYICIIEALVCVVIAVVSKNSSNLFSSVAAFPFEQLGMGLRVLSLSGAVGNIVALLLYFALCLLPCLYWSIRLFKKRARAEDLLLLLMSAVLFAVMYIMINPSAGGRHFGSMELQDYFRPFLGVIVYSILLGYILLRVLRAVSQGSVSIICYLRVFMGVLCIMLVFAISGSGIANLLGEFRKLAEKNTAVQDLGLSYAFLALQYIVGIIPYAANIAIIYTGFELINALDNDPYGPEVTVAAAKVGGICRAALVAVLLSQIGINVLQLLLGSKLLSTNYILSIPLLSVVFILAVLLLTQYFEQARLLKQDNDSII